MLYTSADMIRSLLELHVTLEGVSICIQDAESIDDWRNIYLTLSAIRDRLSSIILASFNKDLGKGVING